MIYTAMIVLAVPLVGGLIYLACLDGGYEVRRSRLINRDIHAVFDKICDFKTWGDWSPWLIHEPDTHLEFSDNCSEVGGSYTWDGQLVGAGSLSHERFDRPHRIEQRIAFTRPFSSVCQVAFDLAERDGGTEITWTMHGKMPFLFRFMAKKTAAMIAKDYDLGLAMLAGRLDPQAEFPRLEFVGETALEPVQAMCEGFAGGIKEMESAMTAGFPRLMAPVEQVCGEVAGKPFTAYHKVNPDTMQFVCDLAVPVPGGTQAGEYTLKTLGGGRFYEVVLAGSYVFLELAWYSAMTHVRMLKLKYDAKRPTLEVYENDPQEVESSNQIRTSLYLPIK